ncbi:hypothetical protein SUGI_0124940 [Cryptomeria japonica]|nr:hypothetical protein SUGI_0124940 [Cryptomeria japonica]
MAVSDGVDIISMSVGGSEKTFYNDSQAIGSFKAMAKVRDRKFPAAVRLGNHKIYKGSSLSQAAQVVQRLPLLYVSHNKSTRRCESGLDLSMSNGKILLYDMKDSNSDADCVGIASFKPVGVLKEISTAAKQVGLAAIIFASERSLGAQETIIGLDLPLIGVSFAVGEKIKAYINSTSNPTATINPTELTVVGKAIRAPLVAFFLRGCQVLNFQIY